jgi:hypothetical protein
VTAKKRIKYLNIYQVGSDMNFEGVPPDRPPKDPPPGVTREAHEQAKRRARTGLHAVRCAVRTGELPPPDMKRGKGKTAKWLWNEEKFERWKEERERETKKADERGNAHQPKSEPHANEATDDGHVPRREQKVNASPGEVRHG